MLITRCTQGYVKLVTGYPHLSTAPPSDYPTKNLIEDLTRSVQISQEMVRSSYQIYLIRTQVKNLNLLYRIIRISKIRSYQDSEQIYLVTFVQII